MGEVFLAHEIATGRNVAMKFVRASGNQTALDRFLIEVRALASLDHPNIIRVLTADFLRSDPFFTMEVADGGTLSKWIETHGPLAPSPAARIMVEVARAIAAAHAKGILHRDLKPSNILLAKAERGLRFAEKAAGPSQLPAELYTPNCDLHPFISDFGLAKRIDTEDGATIGSGPLGSPGFMPPEQISKRNGEVGPASDVYGLGASLYYLLTGRPPYGPGDHSTVMHQVLTEPVPRPRATRSNVPPALDGIVVKCLEKVPTDRYPTADALADDLERFLEGHKPTAPAMTGARRVRRWLSRNRKVLVASALGVALVAALVATGMAMVREPTEEQKREAQRMAIQNELAAGRSVELVGKNGPPRWSEWAYGQETLAPNDSMRDGTFGFTTNGLSLLTLVRDPMQSSYRFEAELCHTGALHDLTFVGVFFGFEHSTGNNGEALWRYLGAHYSEFVSQAEIVIPQNLLEHRLSFHDKAFHQQVSGTWASGSDREIPPIFRFQPAQQPNRWRGIAAEVSPNGIVLFWREDDGSWKQVGNWTPATLEHHRSLQQQRLDETRPGSGMTLRHWSPRASIGLYGRRAGLSFRNVRITPKPQEI